MYYASLFFIAFLVFGSCEKLCPNFISCSTSEDPETCPDGTFYRHGVKVHGCCSGCVQLKGKDEPCSSPAECRPAYTCSERKKCELDPKQACEYYKETDSIWRKTQYWKPVCLPDGTFAPKQCKGSKMAGKCFCVDRMGNRTFGEEEWIKAENVTCACSRLADELKQTGADVTLHCDRRGNFEPLQCDRRACWCASPKTGIPYAPAVPPQAMASLPCHNRNEAGDQYYRQCDSANYAKDFASALLRNHGTKDTAFFLKECNFDGSYYRVQSVKEKKRCVFVDDSPLTEAVAPEGKVDCNCAYDRHVAAQAQILFVSDCTPNGNYRNRQIWNGKVYCVDQDGFYYSNDPNECKPT